MNRKQLFKKYYKSKYHDYEISDTLSYYDDNNRNADIIFLYSGRNRGKSYEVTTQLLADAWYLDKQFGYVRRYDETSYNIEQYFADKTEFIKDMTDNECDGVCRDKGKLKFYPDSIYCTVITYRKNGEFVT